jgi:hypothetical protein
MPTPDIDRDTVPAYRQSHNPKVNACGQPAADMGESSDWRPRPDGSNIVVCHEDVEKVRRVNPVANRQAGQWTTRTELRVDEPC